MDALGSQLNDIRLRRALAARPQGTVRPPDRWPPLDVRETSHPLDLGLLVSAHPAMPTGKPAQCHSDVQRRQAVNNLAQTGMVSRVPRSPCRWTWWWASCPPVCIPLDFRRPGACPDIAGAALDMRHVSYRVSYPRWDGTKKKALHRCKALISLRYFGSPTWARTRDLRINSPALYRLSYRGSAVVC